MGAVKLSPREYFCLAASPFPILPIEGVDCLPIPLYSRCLSHLELISGKTSIKSIVCEEDGRAVSFWGELTFPEIQTITNAVEENNRWLNPALFSGDEYKAKRKILRTGVEECSFMAGSISQLDLNEVWDTPVVSLPQLQFDLYAICCDVYRKE